MYQPRQFVVQDYAAVHALMPDYPWTLDDTPPDCVASMMRAVGGTSVPLQRLPRTFSPRTWRGLKPHREVPTESLACMAGFIVFSFFSLFNYHVPNHY